MGRFIETFVRKSKNAAALNATATQSVDFDVAAGLNNNLPHNSFYCLNNDTTCDLFIHFDDYTDATKPDYVLKPNQSISITPEEGITYKTVFFYNSHASSNIAIGDIVYRIATAKMMDDRGKIIEHLPRY